MRFYTNVQMVGDNFLVRGYENGKHFATREKFYPTLFVDSKKKTKYKTLNGEYVEARDILLGRMFGLAAIGIALGARTDLDEEARTRCGAEVMTRARALSKEKTYLCEPVAACVVEMRRVLGNETFAAVAERAGEDLAEWLRGECAADTLWLACELCDGRPI